MSRDLSGARLLVAELSAVGLPVGTILLALSLTPSLVPRGPTMQGIVAGLSLAAGYAIGALASRLWSYLELPVPSPIHARRIRRAAAAVCTVTLVAFLWRASEWQNSVRRLMEMEPVDTAHPFRVGLIAILLFAFLLGVARLFRWTFRELSARFGRGAPQRVSNVIGLVTAAALFWSILDGVLISALVRAADWSYGQVDARVEEHEPPPEDPWRPGSPASLLDWSELGSEGRNFVAGAPTAAELSAQVGEEAVAPVRVYVGLGAAPDPEARARLALREMDRVGAFERSLLVLVTPTGTGWVDPGAIATVEALHRGDVASVAVQYSYLPSPLALMVEGEYGAATSRALFDEVYGRWTSLPPGERPALFLHGLSLGALNSDASFDLFDIIRDPFHGALWSGPPFRTETWRSVTRRREPESPAWLPEFRNGSVVRFANQDQGLGDAGGDWGPPRLAFLQYASDPITFFEPEALFREPEWMRRPRGPDVSPALRWVPVVTMLQLGADMLGGSEPTGYGHEYAPEHYLDAWLALTEPEGWDEEGLARLRAVFGERP